MILSGPVEAEGGGGFRVQPRWAGISGTLRWILSLVKKILHFDRTGLRNIGFELELLLELIQTQMVCAF